MTMVGKLFLPSFNYLFRLVIMTILLIGLLPVPALAVTNGTIAGQVTDNSTSGAIPGATILIYESGAQSPALTDSTSANGNYSIAIPSGIDYRVAAMKEGYVTEEVSGQSIIANTTTTVNFSLSPGGIIQGTVTDNSTHNAIQGANVRAYQPNNRHLLRHQYHHYRLACGLSSVSWLLA